MTENAAEADFTAAQISEVPDGTVLYAVWSAQEQ